MARWGRDGTGVGLQQPAACRGVLGHLIPLPWNSPGRRQDHVTRQKRGAYFALTSRTIARCFIYMYDGRFGVEEGERPQEFRQGSHRTGASNRTIDKARPWLLTTGSPQAWHHDPLGHWLTTGLAP